MTANYLCLDKEVGTESGKSNSFVESVQALYSMHIKTQKVGKFVSKCQLPRHPILNTFSMRSFINLSFITLADHMEMLR